MNEKKQIESQLNCRATASLSMEVAHELQKEDKPILELMEEIDENKNKQGTSD